MKYIFGPFLILVKCRHIFWISFPKSLKKEREREREDLEATIKLLKEKLHNIQIFVAFRTSEIESYLYKFHLPQKNSLLTNNMT